MFLVTGIEELDVKRAKIYLEGEPAFVLYKGEVRELQLKVNKELSEPDYVRVLTEILPKRAKKRALYLLQKKSYTEWKLREKLREGFYPSPVIDEAIEYLKSYHYIDDYAFARDYIFYRKDKLSKKIIEEKLRAKGISKEALYLVLQEAYPDKEEEEELQRRQALKLLEKRAYNRESTDTKEQQKLYAFLMRKGISSSVIKQVLW